MARTSAIFSTSLADLLAMPWDEALRWYPQALKVWAETWGRKR